MKKKKKIEKEKIVIIFFSIFRNFFSVEIFHLMSRLRKQNFMIIGQGVPEISVRTDTHTNLRIYYIDLTFYDKTPLFDLLMRQTVTFSSQRNLEQNVGVCNSVYHC